MDYTSVFDQCIVGWHPCAHVLYILKKHPMANLKHLSSLHMGLPETGESRNSLANHHVRSQMAMLWHVMPFWKYTQSSDTMHCSCCTTRTHRSGTCVYIHIYVHMLYIYILKFSNITTHTLSHIYPVETVIISHLYPMYILLFHERAMKSHDQKKPLLSQDGTLSQSDLLGALDLASNSLAPSGTPRAPARSRDHGMGKMFEDLLPIQYHLSAWKLTVFKNIKKSCFIFTDELIFWLLAWFTNIDETHKNSVRGNFGALSISMFDW